MLGTLCDGLQRTRGENVPVCAAIARFLAGLGVQARLSNHAELSAQTFLAAPQRGRGPSPQQGAEPKLADCVLLKMTDQTSAHPLALVVDDEELLRLHAAGLLEEHGFEVAAASDASSALKVLETHPDVRLLFTDIQMPGKLDGMGLAREVHARWPNVLLIVASGRQKPPRAEIPDDGRFIEKPYRAQQLYDQVDDLMNKNA